MADVITVDDPADPRLSDYVGLTDADLRRRADAGFCIVEGELAIRRLLTSRYPVRSLLLTPGQHGRLGDALTGTDAPVYVGSLDLLRAVAGFDIHRGAVASAARPPLPDPRDLVRAARRVAVLEGLNDLENLGGIFRNAAAFGIDAMLLDPTCADPLYRRSIRVSLGHVLHVPFARVEPWPDALDVLEDMRVLALTPRRTGSSIWDVAPCERLALLLGAEGPGLTDALLRRADDLVRIPIAAEVDSLNVATAAAIAFHHFAPR